MDYKDILFELHQEAKNNISDLREINTDIDSYIKIIAEKSFTQKGVFTVLTTLAIYKMLHPEQDIRYHQSQLENGFSGRSIDTKYITPTLHEIGLPHMAESGWLTRSLEQPFPYKLDYNGKISNTKVKKAFLELVNLIQVENFNPKIIIVEIFKRIILIQNKNIITFKPLKNPEKLTIKSLISVLEEQFSYNYHTFGGAKLPVLAFYSIYKILLLEMNRYENCKLLDLGSHTASDRTSKSAGDIEIAKDDNIFEVLEIKLDKIIDSNMIRVAKEKILKFNPNRYYILSFKEINQEEIEEIYQIIDEVKENHGCQIVINGVIPSLKYYFRLIDNIEDFISIYSELIEKDTELKISHKKKWEELLNSLES